MDLNGKVCLITGGTKGIGAAAALLFARRGANVAIMGRDLEDTEARDTRTRLELASGKSLVIRGDVGNPADADSAVRRTIDELGGIDVLVHSAGGPVPGGVLEIPPQTWYRAFDVHVHAVFHLCRAAVPRMKQQRRGAIVLVSSVAGIRGLKTNVAYQAVKGAIPQLARALAYELADDEIRVNCVAPGVIRTAFHKEMPDAVKKNNLENRIPLHREGTPEQVASLVRELVENEYVTGETFTIDGGLTMRIC
jgi:NAD(P)-dependent dehydrogenase (short-subunit alcohol dehydrogenase family)